MNDQASEQCQSMAHRDYHACGLRVRSLLPLAGLVPWPEDGSAPDVLIFTGPVAAVEPESGRYFSLDPDGACRLDVPGVARFLVRGGREIIVDSRLPPDAPDLAVFLLGSVFGFLCYQRAWLPLRASCVAMEGAAVAFAGLSGAGKSTLAAKLVELGYPLVADEVTVVRFQGDGPAVLPSFPRQTLWADAIRALELKPGRAVRSLERFQRFEHCASRFTTDPLPLAAICHLEAGTGTPLDLPTPLRGLEAVNRMRAAIYRLAAGRKIAGGDEHLMVSAAKLAAAVPQFQLRRPTDFKDFPEFARRLVDGLGQMS